MAAMVIDLQNGKSAAKTALVKVVRIVHISDTHDKDYDDLPEGDILIHSGDFTNGGRDEEIRRFAAFLKRVQYVHKVVVLGNHEIGLDQIELSAVQAKLGTDIILLHDSSVTLFGIKFWGTSWNNTSQAFGQGESFRRSRWDLIPRDTHVLITHIPPLGVLDLAWDKRSNSAAICEICGDSHVNYFHWGCKSLLGKVSELQIPLHLFGHVHDDVGIKIAPETGNTKTRFSNAAMDIFKRPNVIDLQSHFSDGLHVYPAEVSPAENDRDPIKSDPEANNTFILLCRELERFPVEANHFIEVQFFCGRNVLDLDLYDPRKETVVLWDHLKSLSSNQRWRVQYSSMDGAFCISSASSAVEEGKVISDSGFLTASDSTISFGGRSLKYKKPSVNPSAADAPESTASCFSFTWMFEPSERHPNKCRIAFKPTELLMPDDPSELLYLVPVPEARITKLISVDELNVDDGFWLVQVI